MAEYWKDTFGYIKRSMERRKQREESLKSKSKFNLPSSLIPKNNTINTKPFNKLKSSQYPPIKGANSIEQRNSKLPFPSTNSKVNKGTIPINIGLDFGTSTSKVCIRQALGLADNIPVYPIAFHESGHDLSAFLCPSVVAIENSKLYFGLEAERRAVTAATLLTHLKICLACDGTKCRHSNLRSCYLNDGNPTFLIHDHKVTARELIIAYLAWVLSESMTKVPSNLSTSPSGNRFTCNLGIPIDWLDDNSLLTPVYRRIAYSSWLLSEGIYQGISINTIQDWVIQAERKVIPSDNLSPIQLCPETTAATISYADSPNPNIGLYGLVDIGAWTTDISFFRLSDIALTGRGIRTLAFYSAKTYRTAAGQIDERLCDFLAEIWGTEKILSTIENNTDLAALIRNEREAGNLDDSQILWKGSNRKVPSEATSLARILISSALRRGYIRTLREAYAKETWPQEPKWRNFAILLMGGGSAESCFSDCLCQQIPISGNIMPLSHLSNALTLQGSQILSSYLHRLAIAHGLSFPKALWPDFLPPSEVPVSRETIREFERPDDGQPG